MVSEKKELQLSKHWWNSSHFQLILFLGVILFIIFSLVEFINEAKMANSDEKSSNQNTSTEVQKEEWVERDGIFSREFKDFHGRVYKTEFKLTAITEDWSNPVMIPKDNWFQTDCKGCESGNRIEIMVNNEVVTEGNKKWLDLEDNIEPPVSIKFKANGTPTEVWVVSTKKGM